MPPKQAKPSFDHDPESSYDAGDEAHGAIARTSARSRAPKAGNFEANVLLLLGLACIAFGSALSLLPRFSWKAEQVLNGFDHLGIHGGAVAIGGLVLMGLGLVRRQVSNAGTLGANYDDLLFEQVAADIVLTRGALERLQDATSEMQSEMSALSREVARLSTQPAQQPVVSGGNDDALFGLAASLDKLGARLEQRLKAQHDALQDNLEEMTATLIHARRTLEASAPSLALAAPQAAAVEYEEPRVEHADHEVASDPSSLGVLDTLDDYGTPAPLPQRAPEVEHAPETNAIDELRRHLELDLGQPQAKVGTWEEELEMIETQGSRSKLEQLQALLADDEVRAALESLKSGKPRSAA